MKGITYTQVAQYCVLIFAYLVPAIFISILMTGNPIPQLGFGDTLIDSPTYLLDKLDQVTEDLGFTAYTENVKSNIDIFCITAALDVWNCWLASCHCKIFYCTQRLAMQENQLVMLLFLLRCYTQPHLQ